jgi:leucyl-tRNA synthetase
VNPDDIVTSFGADAMRVYEMFMGPLEATKPWSTSSISGVRRFLDRAFQAAQRADAAAPLPDELDRLVHKTVKKVTEDIEAMRFNTAVSAMMVLTNELLKLEAVPKSAAERLAIVLHPFAPHLAEEMWAMLGHAPSVQAAPWPSFDPAKCEDAQVEIAVQVLGKVRGRLVVSRELSQERVVELARELPGVQTHLEGKALRKVVYVPGKILNLIA